MFNISYDQKNNAKGYQIKFSNGYILSVQWGYMNYCANAERDAIWDNPRMMSSPKNNSYESCHNCETAIIKPNGKFLKYKGDDVQSHQSADEVAKTTLYAQSLESNNYGRAA